MKKLDLPEFIAESRINVGYESGAPSLGFGKIRILGPYCKNGLCYLDVYEDLEKEFAGKVFVTRRQRLAWQLEYNGRILVPDMENVEKIYDEVLKPALREFSRETPWKRGPDRLVVGDYEYLSKCEGDLAAFKNWEKIIHTPTQKEIYSYSDKGKLHKLL